MINERTLPYLPLAPSIVLLLIFFAWPLLEAFLVAPHRHVGSLIARELWTMADDIFFRDALVNTLLLVVVVVPLQLAFALALRGL